MENERTVYVESETATGRKIGVVADEQHGLFKLKYIDGKGGALPDSLTGRFTGVKFAKHALDTFVEKTFKVVEEHTRKPRKEKPAKENPAEVVAA